MSITGPSDHPNSVRGPILWSLDGPEFSGNFPCSLYDCSGCHHFVALPVTRWGTRVSEGVTGFPFELEEEIGKGGFASVYRGRFHQGRAAFKFIQIKNEEKFRYDWTSVGCYEYWQQEKVKD